MDYSVLTSITLILLAVSACCVESQVPLPVDVTVVCPNYNCSMTWKPPQDNTSISDVIKYTVEYEAWVGENYTLVEIPDCMETSQTECNLAVMIDLDSLANVHGFVLSAMLNRRYSEQSIVRSFVPNFKATIDHPDIELIEPVQSTEFTVHIFAPLSPYKDPNTGELYRVDELPPFGKDKPRFNKFKFQHNSILYLAEPSNELEEIQEESGKTLDKMVTFTQLRPYTTYRLEVISFFVKYIRGIASKEPSVLMVTTAEDAPSEGPTVLPIVRKPPKCSISPDTSSVIVTWTAPPPEHHNGQLTHYEIRYMLNGRNFSEASEKNCNVTYNSIVLQLDRWQAYEFAVLVCNAIGCAESRHKTLFNIQALKKGSRPTNISVDYTAARPLLIKWTPPNTTECIDKYLVTIETDDDRKDTHIQEMVIDKTILQINKTLPPGSYMVIVRAFIRSGFDSGTPGEVATKQFMIENKTVTNHLILPLIIILCFIFSAIMVAFVICAKWVLRPFDIHLEKTRALKLARQYHMESNQHYQQTEHEVYDPLPAGSRRPSRISISSILRPGLFRSLSSSGNAGNNSPVHEQNGGARSKLQSHSEEPHENDTLLPSVSYSPLTTESSSATSRAVRSKKRKDARDLTNVSSGSSLGDRPMLTIEVSADNSGQRIVRWAAGGTDSVFDEEEDVNPFDLPRVEDFDESFMPCTPRVSQSAPSTDDVGRDRLNYPSLVSQSSINSDAGTTPSVDVNVTKAHLFEPVTEETSDDEEPHRTSYAQLAAFQGNTSTPNSTSDQCGSINPYSQISNSNAPRRPPSDGADGSRNNISQRPGTGNNISEGYTRLAQCNPQASPSASPSQMRRSMSNPSSDTQSSNHGNSPMQQRRTQSEDGRLSGPTRVASSLYATRGESPYVASPIMPRQVVGASNHSANSSYVPFHHPGLSVGASPSPARRQDHPASGNPGLVNPVLTNGHLASPVASLRHEKRRTEPSQGHHQPGRFSPDGSPTFPRRPQMRVIRLPAITPGSPILPSRALDTAHGLDSDSDDDLITDAPRPNVLDEASLNYPSLESQTSVSSDEASSMQPLITHDINPSSSRGEEYVCNGASPLIAKPPSPIGTSESSSPGLNTSDSDEASLNYASLESHTSERSADSSNVQPPTNANNQEYVYNGVSSTLTAKPPIVKAESCKKNDGASSRGAVPVSSAPTPYVEHVNGEIVNGRDLHGVGGAVERREEFLSDEDEASSSEMSIAAFVNGSLFNVD